MAHFSQIILTLNFTTMEKIKDLKKGDYFKLQNKETATVYVRGEYDRSSKKYSCYRYDDVAAERFFSGDKEVYVDFEF